MTAKEVLVKARGLIEKGWTQKVGSRDIDGNVVFAKDSRASSWCASGAIWAVLPEDVLYSDYTDLLTRQALCDITQFNDDPNTTKNDILEIYDKAIERCEDEN